MSGFGRAYGNVQHWSFIFDVDGQGKKLHNPRYSCQTVLYGGESRSCNERRQEYEKKLRYLPTTQ